MELTLQPKAIHVFEDKMQVIFCGQWDPREGWSVLEWPIEGDGSSHWEHIPYAAQQCLVIYIYFHFIIDKCLEGQEEQTERVFLLHAACLCFRELGTYAVIPKKFSYELDIAEKTSMHLLFFCIEFSPSVKKSTTTYHAIFEWLKPWTFIQIVLNIGSSAITQQSCS